MRQESMRHRCERFKKSNRNRLDPSSVSSHWLRSITDNPPLTSGQAVARFHSKSKAAGTLRQGVCSSHSTLVHGHPLQSDPARVSSYVQRRILLASCRFFNITC